MTETTIQATGMDKQWRFVFIALSIIVAILLPSLSPAYGQTGDEWLQIFYGRDIWDYFFNGDQQALGYDTLLPRYQGMETQFKGQEMYGGLFDFGTEILHRWFPSIPHLVLRHFCNALTNVILIISTGLMARRLSGRWSVGVLALFLILFSPRIFGEGMNNPKDIPFAAGFALGIYAILAFLQDGIKRIWLHALLLALGFGLAFGVRSAGGLLFLAYLVVTILFWLYLHKDSRKGWWADKKHRQRIMIAITGSLIAGYVIGLLAWPWGLESPISHPIESLEGMTNRTTRIRTIFEGRYRFNDSMPWYYELKWIIISNPISVIMGAILFVVLGFLNRKRVGSFTLSLGIFAALFPLFYMAYKNSSVYDTWRHVFFVYPFWVIMAALGWYYLGDFVEGRIAKEGEVKQRYSGHALALLLTIPAILWTIRSHPNQYVYFNELTGGIRGANGNYELDYYYNSSQQHVNWLRKNVPRVAGKKALVLSNMGGFGPNCLHDDTAHIAPSYLSYYRRSTQAWDYYILFPRIVPEGIVKHKSWLPSNAIYVVTVDGVPLSALIKRSDTFDIVAERANNAKDFTTAANYYGLSLQKDPNNPMTLLSYGMALAQSNRLSEAVSAIQKLTQVDPESIQAWGLLAQLHQATGNTVAAQEADNTAKNLIAEQQEDTEEE